MVKRVSLFLVIVALVCSVGFSAVEKYQGNQKGPFVDKVLVNVRMQEEIGLKDAAEGLTDIFFWGVEGSTFLSLDQETLDKLEVYSVPAGSWSIPINPYPNAAPYQAERDGEVTINPFAIEKVRFAFNFLINRKYMVDEILMGAGFPCYTPYTPGQPGTYRYNLIADELGFTPEGNEDMAIQMIDEAMQEAAAHPENAGRLKKGEKYWEFDGKPITLNFYIRVDDPNGRLRKGHYIADQLEKAGFAVNRMERERAICSADIYGTDPADYLWNMLTEGWGAGATRKWWTVSLGQMYASWYGYTPGWAEPTNWSFTNDLIDSNSLKAWNGNFLTGEEYWDLVLAATREALKQSVRVFTTNQENFYVANKERLPDRFAYGLGDGLNRWSLITARPVGSNELRITQFSSRASLFMYPWDPIGTDGFADSYTQYVAGPCGMWPTEESPVSADVIRYGVTWEDEDLDVQVEKDAEGNIVGLIDVPANAIKYNPATNKWEQVGEGVTSFSKCTYESLYSAWHHGVKIGLADFLFAQAFIEEWASRDGENDAEFEAAFSSYWLETVNTIKGWVIHEDGKITTYFDYNFPQDLGQVVGSGAPPISASAAGNHVGVSWEIVEAIALMINEGSASGVQYSFSSQSENEIDVLVPNHVADIRAKLVEMAERNHVPDSIKDFLTPEQAKQSYEAAIKWIDETGHAFISNGPFMLAVSDSENNYWELHAVRDPEFPYNADYWMEFFAVPRMVIDNVNMPPLIPKGNDLTIKVKASKVVFPNDTSEPAENGVITARILSDPEIEVTANLINTGEFKIVFPGTQTNNLQPGNYQVMIEAELPGAVAASTSETIVIW